MPGKSQGHVSRSRKSGACASEEATKSIIIGGASGRLNDPPKTNGLSRDLWIKALEEAGIQGGVDDQDAMTVHEFAAMMGLAPTTARYQLARLVSTGKATKTTKMGRDSRGHRTCYVSYRLL